VSSIYKRNRWEIWRDVIIALFIREIKTGFNDKFGISWSVVSPVAFIFIISFVRGRMTGDLVFTMPMFTFMAIGFFDLSIFLRGDECMCIFVEVIARTFCPASGPANKRRNSCGHIFICD
jgi:hypothetical protein